MAALTPLTQQSLSAPERGRDESVLHWGAAVGAVVLVGTMAANVVVQALENSGFFTDLLGPDAGWDVTDRFYAATVLVTSAAVAVTATFLLADSPPPRVMSWLALGLGVVVWAAAAPDWWRLVGQVPPFDVPAGTPQLICLWLFLTGLAALAQRTWHRWLVVVTLVAAVVAGAWVYLASAGLFAWAAAVATLAVWAVVFAVAQVTGPHPRPAVAESLR